MPYIAGKFVVALFSGLTSSNPLHCRTTVEHKFRNLQMKVEECQLAIGRANLQFGSNGLPFTAIFAAPEYYFTAPTSNRREPMSEDEKMRLEEKIFSLSKLHPGIVIIPGSMFYWKSATRASGQNKLDNAGVKYQTTNPKDRLVKANFKLDEEWKRKVPTTLLSETNRNIHNARSGGTNHAGAFYPSINEKKTALADANIKILRNSTGIYLGGVRYGKYDKQEDCYETFRPNEMVFIAGTKDECPKIGECRFGLEICVDHDCGLLGRRKVQDVHFHTVVSDWVQTKPGNMAMCNGGYFLHSSSNFAETKLVYKDPSGKLHERTKQPRMTGQTESISFYVEDWQWGVRPRSDGRGALNIPKVGTPK